MSYTLYTALLSLGLFTGMLILLEVDRRIGVRRLAQDPAGARPGFGTIAALYGHWILGKQAIKRQPRWSIIRNMLHWVD